MEIRDLRVFVAVVEEGGLSPAARRLHMSQSSLSQIIQSLEKQLGGRLLERDHAGARPTERGSFLLQEARNLVAHHDRLVAEMTNLATAGNAPLRIGVPLELPPDLLPSAVARVSGIFPDLVVQLRHAPSADQLVALTLGELDLALLRDRPIDRDIDSVLAVEEPMGVILTASRAEGLAQPAGVPLHHLAGLRWVGFSRGDAPAWHDQVSATLRSHGVTGIDWVVEQDRPVTPKSNSPRREREVRSLSPRRGGPARYPTVWSGTDCVATPSSDARGPPGRRSPGDGTWQASSRTWISAAGQPTNSSSTVADTSTTGTRHRT
jgi:DNA-binding transcriptional LysR family regulator